MRALLNRTGALAAAMLAALLLPTGAGFGQVRSDYAIRPSEVKPPDGVTLGQYQRTIRPFPNWVLICDENLKTRQMVCNVTQTVEDAAGNLVFSWSLAATAKGTPYMILRTAPVVPKDGLISFRFEGRDAPVEVRIDGCNQSVCVGMVPVGPILRKQIAARGSPRVSYTRSDGSTVVVEPELAGLSEALSAIK